MYSHLDSAVQYEKKYFALRNLIIQLYEFHIVYMLYYFIDFFFLSGRVVWIYICSMHWCIIYASACCRIRETMMLYVKLHMNVYDKNSKLNSNGEFNFFFLSPFHRTMLLVVEVVCYGEYVRKGNYNWLLKVREILNLILDEYIKIVALFFNESRNWNV